MRNYQKVKNNPYLLPHNLYMRVLYIIKDYDRLKEEYREMSQYSAPLLSGMPGKGEQVDATEEKGIRLAMLFGELHAIDQAKMMIPGEYREHVILNITQGVRYPDFAHYNTWRYNKYKLCYNVAKILKMV